MNFLTRRDSEDFETFAEKDSSDETLKTFVESRADEFSRAETVFEKSFHPSPKVVIQPPNFRSAESVIQNRLFHTFLFHGLSAVAPVATPFVCVAENPVQFSYPLKTATLVCAVYYVYIVYYVCVFRNLGFMRVRGTST